MSNVYDISVVNAVALPTNGDGESTQPTNGSGNENGEDNGSGISTGAVLEFLTKIADFVATGLGLFKTGTGHLNWTEANVVANRVVDPMLVWFQGKFDESTLLKIANLLKDATIQFWKTDNHWDEGARLTLINDLETYWQQFPNDPAINKIDNCLWRLAVWTAQKVDAGRFDAEFSETFDYFIRLIVAPVIAEVTGKQVSIPITPPSTDSTTSSTSTGILQGNIGIIILIGIALAVVVSIFYTKKSI